MISSLDTIFSLVEGLLTAGGVRCVLIGGFAVNHYGYSRNTVDVDFMVASDDMAAVRRVFVEAGYSNVTSGENAVFFQSPHAPLRVDFLHVDADTMSALVARARPVDMHGHRILVPALKDLLGMKLFALAHAQNRRMDKDLPDIAHLCVIHNLNLESDIRPLCEQFANASIFRQVSDRVRSLCSP